MDSNPRSPGYPATVGLCASGRARHDRRIGRLGARWGARGRSFEWQTEIIRLEGVRVPIGALLDGRGEPDLAMR